MAARVSNHRIYYLGVNGQCKLYLNSVLWLVTQTPLAFNIEAHYLVQWLLRV